MITFINNNCIIVCYKRLLILLINAKSGNMKCHMFLPHFLPLSVFTLVGCSRVTLSMIVGGGGRRCYHIIML